MRNIFSHLGPIEHGLLAGSVMLGSIAIAYFGVPFSSMEYDAGGESETANFLGIFDVKKQEEETPVVASVPHVPMPESLKGVYMTACAAATPSFREHIVHIIETTAVNAVIIDIKDYSGTVSFYTGIPELDDATENASGCVVRDMKEFVADLHAKHVYVIGRITVFQDPYYAPKHPSLAVQRKSDGAVWKDRKGISFVDVSAEEYWDVIISLSRASYLAGFDEINYDYVRFPSDGNMKDIYFPKSATILAENGEQGKAIALENFFIYLSTKMHETEWLPKGDAGPILSADLFGMTASNTDDLGIGQVLERAAPYFDVIAPMVYPSHYPPQFNGYTDPNDHPYDIIKYAMDTASARLVAIGESPLKLRPWLQDFDYPVEYTPAMVSAQIRATYDAGLTSWMMWDPANTYTPSVLSN